MRNFITGQVMRQIEIHFRSDSLTLRGILHLPPGDRPPVVIGSHGLLSSGDSPKQIALAEQCIQRGIAFFRFDHRGCSQSQGDFAQVTTFDGRCRDLRSAIKTIFARSDTGNRIALFGSSFGGAVCIAVCADFPAASLITVAAPVQSSAIRPPYIIDPSKRPLLNGLDRERLGFDVRDRLGGVNNILIFHGDADEIVPFENALKIYESAKAPKRLVRQAGGDHPMSNPRHQAAFMRLSLKWFENGFKPA